MYGDIIRNAITEIANLLNRNKNIFLLEQNTSKESRVKQTIYKNTNMDTKGNIDKLKNIRDDTRETRVKNNFEIPKLPSFQQFLKNYNDTN